MLHEGVRGLTQQRWRHTHAAFHVDRVETHVHRRTWLPLCRKSTGLELAVDVNFCGVHLPMAWLWDTTDRVRRRSADCHAGPAASLNRSQT